MAKSDTKTSRKRGQIFWMIFATVGIIIGVVAAYNIYLYFAATSGAADTPTDTVIVEVDGKPDEKKPDIEAEYSVPADQPRRIIIKKTSTNGFIQRVGVTSQNQVSVPSNIHIAGWFVNSVKPGQNGLSIIDGHVGGIYSKEAIFSSLKELEAGDKFQIEFGDLHKKKFEVVDKRQLVLSKSADFLFGRDNTIESQLNLVTCGGEFDDRKDTYRDRIIIVSKLIDT